MEEQITKAKETSNTAAKPNYAQFLLPGAILLAALIISGTLIFTRSQGGTKGIAQIRITSDDHILGNKDAKVTIVEYADFRCLYCERFFTQTEPSIIQDYVNQGKANFVFKNFAFLGQQSVWASEAAECAGDQNKFWQYHDWLYKNQALETDLNYYSKENLIKYAGQVGLNTNQFTSCLNSDKYLQRVSDDRAQGQKYYEPFKTVDRPNMGTPTFFVNGTMIVGAQPYETFKQAIDNLLK